MVEEDSGKSGCGSELARPADAFGEGLIARAACGSGEHVSPLVEQARLEWTGELLARANLATIHLDDILRGIWVEAHLAVDVRFGKVLIIVVSVLLRRHRLEGGDPHLRGVGRPMGSDGWGPTRRRRLSPRRR